MTERPRGAVSTAVEPELQAQLGALGFEPVRVTGLRGNRILYVAANGAPVMDAPIAVLLDGHVVLRAPFLPARSRAD